MVPDEFIITIGDAHLYSNSIDAAKEMLNRESLSSPILQLNPDIDDIYDFRYDDIQILNYEAHQNIKVEVAVWHITLKILDWAKINQSNFN